jgi:peroxiredoxin
VSEAEGRTYHWQLWIALGLIAIGMASILLIAFPQFTPIANQDSTDSSNEPAPMVGAIAPDFNLPNLDQERIHLSDFKGRPIMLNFWATWCDPCLVEMPFIQERYEEFAEDGLVVLAINYAEPEKVVEAFRDEFNLTFELVLDPVADVQRLYKIRGYPTSVFIDTEGIIQVIYMGLLSENQLDSYLARIGFEPR